MRFTSDVSNALSNVLISSVYCVSRPIFIKIAASHDFSGGLAAFIFMAGYRLAAIFTAGGRLA